MQRCRAVRAEAAAAVATRDESANVAPSDAEDGSSDSKSILCEMAVKTGLSFFFFMLDRDPEAKSFLLQTVSGVLADLRPLALLGSLGPLELESLAKMQVFLTNTAAAQHEERADAAKTFSTGLGVADNALSSLISLALARGDLAINLTVAKLLYSNPSVLKLHHLRQLRQIVSVRQSWSFDTEPSCSIRTRIFRPCAGSADELVAEWERRVLPVLKACIPEEGSRREKWRAIAAKLEAGRPDEAKAMLSELVKGAGGSASDALHGAGWGGGDDGLLSKEPSTPALLGGSSTDGPLENDDCGMGPGAFLDHAEHVLASGGQCDGVQACAVVMSCLQLVAKRLELPRIIPPHLVGQRPAHCIADDDDSAGAALYSFLQQIACSPANDEGQVAGACAEPAEERSVPECARRRIVYAWLTLVRVNLEWCCRSR